MDLERLLEQDRRGVAKETADALRSGLARRIVTNTAESRGRVWVPVLALAAVVVVIAVAVSMRRPAPPRVEVVRVESAPVVVQPAPVRQPLRVEHSAKLARVTRLTRADKKPLAPMKPFAVPGAPVGSERVLLALARARPEERAMVVEQQSAMREADAQKQAEFVAQFHLQGEGHENR